MPQPTARDRLRQAAFELFEQRGYDRTTVDDFAARAGVGRTTFFRVFGSKEDVIFPDHDEVLGRIQARLAASSDDTSMIAVSEAAGIVLDQYLGEGELARTRYRLTSSVPALRDRENASIQQYTRHFRHFLLERMADQPDAALRSELMAAAIVTAHNHVLRRWLRGEAKQPRKEFARAMALTIELYSVGRAETGTSVVVLRSAEEIDVLLPRLREAIAHRS
jgi:AcrR family transcriptional regulator